mmetsp:Transcript_28500/g.46012  ORF Transcript_28500/g.46012 Transcript_28500/m.46012 type:complete len:142 (-) Transcript_28500:52-477(-)
MAQFQQRGDLRASALTALILALTEVSQQGAGSDSASPPSVSSFMSSNCCVSNARTNCGSGVVVHWRAGELATFELVNFRFHSCGEGGRHHRFHLPHRYIGSSFPVSGTSGSTVPHGAEVSEVGTGGGGIDGDSVEAVLKPC